LGGFKLEDRENNKRRKRKREKVWKKLDEIKNFFTNQTTGGKGETSSKF